MKKNKWKKILIFTMLTLCFFSTIKYHQRFNLEKKFHELSDVNFKNSIPAKKIDYRFLGLNWITPGTVSKDDAMKELTIIESIKLDLKKIQLFLSTRSPKIFYHGTEIPITEIKVYSNINKILKSQIEVSKIIFKIERFKIQDIQKISTRIKPSNFKTYLLNNLQEGEIEKALFDLNINKDFKLIDYKASGVVKEVNAKIKNNFTIKNISFNFIADSNLTLINSIKAKYESITIANGSIDLQRKKPPMAQVVGWHLNRTCRIDQGTFRVAVPPTRNIHFQSS